MSVGKHGMHFKLFFRFVRVWLILSPILVQITPTVELSKSFVPSLCYCTRLSIVDRFFVCLLTEYSFNIFRRICLFVFQCTEMISKTEWRHRMALFPINTSVHVYAHMPHNHAHDDGKYFPVTSNVEIVLLSCS